MSATREQLFALSLAQKLRVAIEQELHLALREVCPDHNPVQHRDMKQPWCKACGRDALGYPVRFQS